MQILFKNESQAAIKRNLIRYKVELNNQLVENEFSGMTSFTSEHIHKKGIFI